MNLYLQNVKDLQDPKEDVTVLSGIPEWRKEKILNYLRPCDRRLSFGVWRLLEKVLELNGASPDEVMIDQNGKLKCGDLQFNLSHSADVVLCTVGDRPIGCDVEKVAKAPFEVAERYFRIKECQYIAAGCTEAEKNRRFFRLWTMKESYLKMTGEGMGVSPERIEIDLNTFTVFRDDVPQPCDLQNFALDTYEVSICEYKDENTSS